MKRPVFLLVLLVLALTSCTARVTTPLTLQTSIQRTPMTAGECKDGGWQSFRNGTEPRFSNQGECVSFVNAGK
ncbi:MAG: hypothetical protein JSV66_04565 [Trueperaceae bacterium]|nr:MAG: hypothetical protein JSV66_04565 [Trueperaceae bacterium]